MSSPIPKIRSMIAVSVFAALLGTLLLAPLSAAAASIGPGYQQPGKPLNHLGGYLSPGGRVAYCIDAGLPSAVARDTSDSGVVGSVNGLTAAEMLGLNTLLVRHGDTSDANTAAAVAMAVWTLAGNAAYQAEGGDGYVLERAPADQRLAIRALADQFRAEAAATMATTSPATPPTATLSISIDEGDDYGGILALDASPGVTGTVVLRNAVFADTGGATRSAVSAGARLAIIAAPPSGSTAYRVLATSSDLVVPTAPAASVHVYSTSGAQNLVAAGDSSSIVLASSASDLRDRLIPSLGTTAQSAAKVGGTVSDTTSVLNVPSSGVQLRWAGYLQPIDESTPQCSASTLAFESSEPVTITTDGIFSSELFAVTDRSIGTVFWVATATRNDVTVAEGFCGDTAETTVITAAKIPLHLPVVSG